MEHFRLRLLVHFPTQRPRAKKSTAGRSQKAESSSLVLVRKGPMNVVQLVPCKCIYLVFLKVHHTLKSFKKKTVPALFTCTSRTCTDICRLVRVGHTRTSRFCTFMSLQPATCNLQLHCVTKTHLIFADSYESGPLLRVFFFVHSLSQQPATC
jgi:hypothetical protein